MTRSTLDVLIQQQDYFWFLAGIGFAAALVMGLRSGARGEPAGPWLPWVAGGNLLMVGGELINLSQPVQMNPMTPFALRIDLVLGGIMAVQVWGFWARRERPGAAAAWGVAVALLAWLRRDHPWSATLVLALAGTAGLLWPRGAGTARSSRALLAAALATLWLSPVGPLTCALHNQLINRVYPSLVANAPPNAPLNHLTVGLRRWAATGSWGLWVSATFLAAAVIFVLVLTARLPRASERQEWKRFASLAAIWLVLGIFLAAYLARGARSSYEASAVAYARLAAKLLPPADLEAAFGPVFTLGEIQPGRRPGVQHGTVSQEYRDAVRPVRRFLAEIERNSPSEIVANLLVDRDGWRTIAANAEGQTGRIERVPPHQFGTLGIVALARAPLVLPDGRFVGWLVLFSDPEPWQAGQSQVRMQAFAIIALGLALAVMGLRQRLKVLERDDARLADQTKTEFLARVSHELRTPIQSVLGYSELLKSAVQGETARNRLAALRQHGQLMLRLVNDLLNLSALQSGRFPFSPKPTSVAELVRQTVESLRPEAETKGLAYQMTVAAPPAGWHLADGERLRQVVINLVSNAIKFTDRGEIAVTLGEWEGLLELRVRDTGPGIAPAELARLFKPFARLERTIAKEGTGLGLALARALCESMGGGIRVESELGGGTQFIAHFRLPGCPEPAYARGTPALSLAGRRILVVDDNTLIRELFCDYLCELGARCVAVADGAAALAAVRHEAFDAAVLDQALPGMSGLELARQLRAGGQASLLLVGVSAHAGDEAGAQALAAGMDGFLGKPVELPELAAALRAQRPAEPERAIQKTGLTERLHAQFRAEASVLEAALDAALAEADWLIVQAKAHYLKNSADVLQLRVLAEACRDLEEAAIRGDAAAARAALQVCRQQLADWH